jgi:hypothetical protein
VALCTLNVDLAAFGVNKPVSMECGLTALAYTNLAVFIYQIGQDTRAYKILDRQVFKAKGLKPWECPTTTPCSGRPDSPTIGSWRVDSAKRNFLTKSVRVYRKNVNHLSGCAV